MKNLLYVFLILTSVSLSKNPDDSAGNFLKQNNPEINFTENKGQVHDQNNNNRPDVLFTGNDGKLSFHIKKTGISYQLNRVDKWKTVIDPKTKEEHKEIVQQTFYRIDVNWLNTNVNSKIQLGRALPGYNNYYKENCPSGINNIKSYTDISLLNIYENINLHYYQKNNTLKCDYIIAPNTDYTIIQLKINGAIPYILEDGSVLLKTPLGDVKEGKPIAYQNGKEIKANWKIKNNTLSFYIEDYNPLYELIIDPPTRIWGTYYGSSGYDFGLPCATDKLDNVYFSGYTSSGGAIATTGAYQISYAGGAYDAFLVKFNSNGVRQWGTYYGGTGDDFAYSCSTDTIGNIYMAGWTSTTNGTVITSGGAHQQTYGGGTYDALLVKFDSNGFRKWSTYYGGTGSNDFGYFCTTDATGFVYLIGETNSNQGISTAGAHQISYGGGNDAFIAKFDSTGIRQWGSYYGGGAQERGFASSVDLSGNVYLAGECGGVSGTVVATTGSHQFSSGGSYDGFLAKFNSNGIRQWGTFYGGAGMDGVGGCATDMHKNVYISGNAGASGPFATPGAHQTIYGGSTDAFLAKFDSTGTRQWGTYYGSSGGSDQGQSCSTDKFGGVYLAGVTGGSSGTVIATTGAFQTINGGGYDAFLVQFSNSGVRQWGTYIGGPSNDNGLFCDVDNVGNAYISGNTASSGGVISTVGSHQQFNGGGGCDGFLVKFTTCASAPTLPSAINGSVNICNSLGAYNYSVSPVSGALSYSWTLPNGWSGVSSTNKISALPGLSGIISVAAINGCGISATRTLNVTVNGVPGSPNSISGPTLMCVGVGAQNYSISAVTGATSYSWNLAAGWAGASTSNTLLATPGISGIFSVVASNSCGVSVAQNLSVTVSPLPTITVNSGTICSGQSFTIIPSGANIYSITGGNTIVSPTITTSYSVVGTSIEGCLSTNAAISNVTVNTTPTISVNSGNICSGQSFTITPSGADNFTITGGTDIVSPNSTTSYTIFGSSNDGCYSQNTAISTISVYPLPIINIISGNPDSFCSNMTTSLTANGAINYTWTLGPIGNPIIITPSVTTNYTVTGVDNNGCINTQTITQEVVDCTGLKEEFGNDQQGEFIIIPNPFKDKIIIKMDKGDPINVEIYNIYGSLIYSGKSNTENLMIDLSKEANGVYFVCAGNKIKKIIKL